MFDLTKIHAENQKEIIKLIAPAIVQNLENSESESEGIVPNTIKSKTTSTSKTTPLNSRNMVTGTLNDSTTKSQNNNVLIANKIKAVLPHQDYYLHPNRKHSSHLTFTFLCES